MVQIQQWLEALPGRVAILSESRQILQANSRWQDSTLGRDELWKTVVPLAGAFEKALKGQASEFVHDCPWAPEDQPFRCFFRVAPLPQTSPPQILLSSLSLSHGATPENEELLTRVRRRETLLRIAGKVAGVGGWALDADSQKLTVTEGIYRALGLEPGVTLTLSDLLRWCSSETAARIEEGVERCLTHGTPFDLEVEILTPKNEVRWFRCRGEAERDEFGKIARAHGAVQDITGNKTAALREQATLQRLIHTLESIHDAFYTLDREWRITYANKEAERLFQRRRQDVSGNTIWEEFPDLLGTVFERQYRRVLEAQEAVEFEANYDSLNLWLRIRAFPTDEGLAVYCMDITQQRQAREALEESQHRFQELAEHVNDVFYSYDPHGRRILYVSPAYSKIWGRPLEEVRGRPEAYLEGIHPDDRANALEVLKNSHEPREAVCEYRVVRPDGEIRWVLDHSYPILGHSGRTERVVGTARDVTPQHEAFVKLKASEERFRLLAQATNDAVWDWDPQTDKLWGNEGYQSLVGLRDTRFADRLEWVHPADRDRVRSKLRSVLAGTLDRWTVQYRLIRSDGRVGYVIDRGYALRDADGKPVRLIGGLTDLSEGRSDEALRAALLDQASDAILVFDTDDTVVYLNSRAEAVYGYRSEEVVGGPVERLFPTDDEIFQRARSAVTSTYQWSGEFVHRNGRGDSINIMARWSLVRGEGDEPSLILAIHSDITEGKKLERQFLRSQRLESIGTLAGGLAHDLNNLLAPILLSTDFLASYTQDPEARAILDAVKTSAERGAALVKRLLGFARGFEGHRQLIDPAETLQEIRHVLKDTLPPNIDLRFTTAPGSWTVDADPTQFHQVVMNLCVNARDAMPQGGCLEVSLDNVTVDEMYTEMNPDVRPGPYVRIKVVDTGEGMSPDTQVRVFEPFFTTKKFNKGTGLGLSTCFSIVRGHGGFIHLYSELNRGTTFEVYLPALIDVAPADADAQPVAPARRGQNEQVLLVDDEPDVRQVTRKALEQHGYRVLDAANGAEALSLFVQHRDQIDLVLTDMMMPIMDGPATMIAIRALDSSVPLIAASGLPSPDVIVQATGAGAAAFIAKPFSAKTLLETIGQVLEESQAERGRQEPIGLNLPSVGSEPEGKQEKRETLLVVDDEPSIIVLAQRLLQKEGYTVLSARSAQEALGQVDRHHQDLSLLVTDLNMPGMGGVELGRKVKQRYPHIKLLFVSGESMETTIGRDSSTLPKPFDRTALLSTVRQVLDS